MLRLIKDINEKMLLGYGISNKSNVYREESGEEIITVDEEENIIKISTNDIFLYCSHDEIHGYMKTLRNRIKNTCIEPGDLEGKDLYEDTEYKLFDILSDKEKETYQLLFEKVIKDINEIKKLR